MPISKSYPYLDIAKQYGYPYETILAIADFIRTGNNTSWATEALLLNRIELDDVVVREIKEAGHYFSMVQRGIEPFPPA